ncbi:MAG: hypothetical protein AAB309_00445 [Deltaproteobacteria bacterium]
MELNVTNKKDEPLLSRTMLQAELEFEKATPSYPEIIQLLATHLKVEEKVIAIRHVYTHFGLKKADVIAYCYADENKKNFAEPKKKGKKEKVKEEAKK